MRQTEQMARHHDVWHYALWSLIQQKRNSGFAGIPAGRMGNAGERPSVDQEQHLEQLPMYEFLVRIRAQLLVVGAQRRNGGLAQRLSLCCHLPAAATVAVPDVVTGAVPLARGDLG